MALNTDTLTEKEEFMNGTMVWYVRTEPMHGEAKRKLF